MFMRLLVCGVFVAGLGAFPAAAQSQDTPRKQAAAPAPPAGDERICETVTMLGSRLTKKRFCGTRAEWEEKRRRDREEVDRVQRSPCVPLAGC